jgi:hypothetical protein
MKSVPPWRRFVAASATIVVVFGLREAPAEPIPIVRIAATQPATSEPRPDARIVPGEFTITRSLAGADPLIVHVRYAGSAMPGSDYEALPREVTIPAGALSATVRVFALSDSNANEGEENVVALLEPPPPGAPPTYFLDPQNWAAVIIHDGPAVPLPPLVTITSMGATPEFCDDAMICVGIDFRLKRTGSGLDSPLTVYLRYEGTATPEVDYPKLPSSVTFSAGQDTTTILAAAIDDDQIEGDETIVAVIDDPRPHAIPYRHFNTSDRATVEIRDNDGPPPLPVVTVRAEGFPALTGEPCPVCFVAPVQVTLARSGPLDHALSVGLDFRGTATPGVDYVAPVDPFVIPAGKASASLLLMPLDDLVPEGPEIVEISLRPSAHYASGEPHTTLAVIGDDESGAPTERLDFVDPPNGTAFPSGVASIRIRALAVSTRGEIDHPTQFFANGVLIGHSNPPQFGRPPVPFLPREHDMVWNAPADGEYVLTARVEFSLDQWLEAPPIRITVGPAVERPVVSIVATQRIAEEDSAPTLRPFIYRGEFTISRTGPVVDSLPVYLHVSGTAAPGVDYKVLPFVGTIPAGAVSTTVQVEAIPDGMAEPIETVIAEVSNCPPDNIRPPCFDFGIDPTRRRDTVFIRDDGITLATLDITAPPKGAHFAVGQEISMDALAIDIEGAITSVDFFAGDGKIGTSQIFFIVEPEPGTPIAHNFTWTGAPAGTHELTVRATASNGSKIVSMPVTITVGANRPPEVAVTNPANGAEFPVGAPIEIVAAATDPDGYADHADFFADGRKIGTVTLNFLVPPPPGETQMFSFTWRDAPPGGHILSVRVRDSGGAGATSAPVAISVTTSDGLPVVIVLPADPFAVEPSGGHPANAATFRLRRFGPTAAELAVNVSLAGSATNGGDYSRLGVTAIFPPGESSTPVVIDPLDDDETEFRETVILQVEPQFDDGPLRYHVGRRRRAVAVIADRSWHSRPFDNFGCVPLGGGLFHLCFPAAPAIPLFRIEATDDFRRWETVHEAVAEGDAIHFVDPDTPNLLRRFFRAVPEPVDEGQ